MFKNAVIEHLGPILITLIVGLLIIYKMGTIGHRLLNKSRLDPALHKFIINSMRILFFVILIIVMLGQLNIPTAPIITVLGAVGAAVAFALKESLSNIASGIIILMTGNILKGEVIEVQGTTGSVDSIDLFITKIHTFDNKAVAIPNSIITNNIVINYSREDFRRVDCIFTIGYSSDIGVAKKILENVALVCPDVLQKPEPIIGVSSHGESGIFLDMKVWCPTDKYFDVKYFLEENVKRAFDEQNIEIPFNQLEVKIKK